MKRHGRLLIAAVVCFGLLGWVLTQERGRAPQRGEAFGLDAKQATALQVKGEAQQLTLQKQDDQWMLTEPVKAWADKDAVERMLKSVAELKPSGSREGLNINDPKFGLDKPRLTATLTYGGNKTVSVQLGSQVPGGSEFYAKIDNRNELYFVPASLQTDLLQQPEMLRDKAVAHFDKADVTSVTLQYPEQVIVLEKRGTSEEPQWMLTKPYEAKADEWSAQQVAEKLSSLKADGFASEPAPAGANYGFDKPALKATVTTRDKKQYVITLGAKTDAPASPPAPGGQPPSTEAVYAQLEGRPEVLLLPASLLTDLKKNDMDLRDKRIVDLKKENVQELKVQRKEGLSFTVRRLPDGWQLVAPEAGRAKATKVDDLLWDLTELEAQEFLGQQQDLKAYGLALPDTIVTATPTGSKNPVKLYIGYKKAEGLYYAKTDSDQVYVISEMMLLDLPKTLAELKEAPGDRPQEPAAGQPAPGTVPTAPVPGS
ncbi:MAG: DUF4340 domain-containing protein [Armatimonadota bacterium]